MRSNIGLKTRWFSADDKDELLEILCKGDLLEFKRDAFEHWAVCVVNDYTDPIVVHLTGGTGINCIPTSKVTSSASSYSQGYIADDVFWDVLNGQKVRINNSRDLRGFKPKTTAEIVKTALEAIANTEQGSYDLLKNNCEHFANYCRYGEPISDQVLRVLYQILAAGSSVAVVAGLVLLKTLMRAR